MSILCKLGIHKYITGSREILTTDGKTLKTKTIPIVWCEHCHKPKNYEQAAIDAIINSVRAS